MTSSRIKKKYIPFVVDRFPNVTNLRHDVLRMPTEHNSFEYHRHDVIVRVVPLHVRFVTVRVDRQVFVRALHRLAIVIAKMKLLED